VFRYTVGVATQRDSRANPSPVTAVMITRNRCDEAVQAIERLLQLPERPPIIVVDNSSTDDTLTAVSKFADRVTIIPLTRNAGAAGRNAGVEAARTPYIAFVDDDSSWKAGSLAQAAAVMAAHPSVAVLAAQLTVGEQQSLDPACRRMAASPLPADSDLPGPPVLGFIACAAVVRRDAFLAVGGFDERYGVGGEERSLALELADGGWKLAYVEDVRASHRPSPVRDRVDRGRVLVRNELWLAWSRRPWPSALRVTARFLRRAVNDSVARAGVVAAARQAGSVLRVRRCVAPWLEQQLQLIE
jgi:GT2 family glycosyltransferase